MIKIANVGDACIAHIPAMLICDLENVSLFKLLRKAQQTVTKCLFHQKNKPTKNYKMTFLALITFHDEVASRTCW